MKPTRRKFSVADIDEEDTKSHMDTHFDAIHKAFETHIDAETSYSTTTPAGANTDFKILHNLGYIPQHFLLVHKKDAGDIYKSPRAWTNTAAWFRCTTASCRITVLIW